MNTGDERKIFTLREVAEDIQRAVREALPDAVWIRAEMNKLNHYPHSGHCYPELVEKQDGKVVAQLRANLWRDDYLRINRLFLQVLKEPLKDGITILLLARVTFDPVYGLALRILEIDPSYSLGELEREKQATLERLRKEGLFDLNKRTELALLPQRIAVISVETSKGYADFLQVIDRNPFGYKFFHMLFPAVLQGDAAVEQITAQLARIRRVAAHFDVVAIIRGGGGDVGLSCYNQYALARAVTQFPIPVLTGIGHSTNETVTELVSFRNAITPTELGDFLLQQMHNFAVPVDNYRKSLATEALRALTAHRKDLEMSSASLVSAVQAFLLREARELQHLTELVGLTDPVNVLKRGYSITLMNGKAVTAASVLSPGEEIETRLYDGSLRSIVKETES